MRVLPGLLLLLSLACGGAAHRPTAPGLAPITLPPDAHAAASLAAAQRRAADGDGAAAWRRVHNLVNLFDWARFGDDAAARALLLAATGVTDAGPDAAARGRTTDAVLDAILVEVDALLGRERLHAGGGAARVLLDGDRHPPADRAGLLARAVALKAIARGNGPLAANATLRLLAMCDRAFRDALAAPARERPLLLATCLYPLWDADPAPYFDADPARRPPPPSWEELDARRAQLVASLGRGASRLAPLAARLRAAEEKALAAGREAGLWPRALDPRAMGVPMVADPGAALPYDWEPLIFVDDPSAAELARFAGELGGMLETDGRGRVALALRADAAARGLLDMAALARRLGAAEVELVVGFEQQVRAPAGDYWYGRARDGHVPRAGVLRLLADPAALGARAGLGLTLVVEPTRWQIVAPSGAMPPIAIGADVLPARTELRAQLAAILDAFPDEAGLVVVPDPQVTIAALASAVHAAARTGNGVALVGALAVGATRPRAGSGELAARVERRAGARVTVVPDALAPHAARARRCVQDALDARAVARGVASLEIGPKGLALSGGDGALARCFAAALERPMRDAGISRARVNYGGP